MKAKEYAKKKHQSQKRKDGRPYIIHPEGVANLVREYGGDWEQEAIAWLHDVIEDTQTSYEEIKNEFGESIADGVQALTNPENLTKEHKAEYLANKINTMTPKLVTIKLCDRLNNVRDFENAPSHFVKAYKRGTEELLKKIDMNKLSNTQLQIVEEIKYELEKY